MTDCDRSGGGGEGGGDGDGNAAGTSPSRGPTASKPDGGASDREARTVPWRGLLAETAERLHAAGVHAASQEARWIVEEASGLEGSELVMGLDRPATVRGVSRLDELVSRRCGGEPIQYVLGRWGFRSLDLLCDHRALIPRPETEQVVGVAIAELDRVLTSRPHEHRPVVLDLGTGTGAIALSIVVERPGAHVCAVDSSADALAVARANLAGLGMAGTGVRLVEGSWFEPLPSELRGTVDLIVTNPPYVAAHEELPPSVAGWEPNGALVAGPTGLEAYEVLVDGAAEWLAPGGTFVAEIGTTQGPDVMALATAASLVDVRVERDHAGHDRTLVAHHPT